MSGKTGQYSNRMRLQEYTETRSAAGQMKKSWVDLTSMWASIDVAYKGEEMMGGSRESETPKLGALGYFWIKTPYRTDVTFSSRYRIVFGSRIFNIVIATDTKSLHREWKILVTEVQP